MKRNLFFACIITLVCLSFTACNSVNEPSQIPSSTSTKSTSTASATQTTTPSPTVTKTHIPTRTPTKTATPTQTAVPYPLVTPPAGLIYLSKNPNYVEDAETKEIWLVSGDGKSQSIFRYPEETYGCSLSSDLKRVLCNLTVYDIRSKNQIDLHSPAAGITLRFATFWDSRPDVILAYADKGESAMGAQGGKTPAIVPIDGSAVQILNQSSETWNNWGVLDASEDGNWIAYDQQGLPWIYRYGQKPVKMAVENYGFHPVEWHLWNPSWSPDSRKIAWNAMWKDDMNSESITGIIIFNLARGTFVLFSPLDVLGYDGGASHIFLEPGQSTSDCA